MAPTDNADRRKCQWLGQAAALQHFATFQGATQGQEHIKPLHWYVACRLVVEGGFEPADIAPRPPFRVARRAGRVFLEFAPEEATGGEATILGGLKTKDVDIVVSKPGIGPVLAVSCKGMTGALRNLTNRMEETIGECTNLHITYPALVFGYFFIVRANRQDEETASVAVTDATTPAKQLAANDIAIQRGGEPAEAILRFHAALKDLTGRRGIRDDVSRYEAVTLAMVETGTAEAGKLLPSFPPASSLLRLEEFFKALYLRYDERYVYAAPDLKKLTRRREWSPDSPAFSEQVATTLGYEKRLSDA